MGQRHASAALYPGNTRYPFYMRRSGPQGRSGQERKMSPSPGFDPRTLQSVTSRYTDYATRPTRLWRTDDKTCAFTKNIFHQFRFKEFFLLPFLIVTCAISSSLPSSYNLKQLPPSLKRNVFLEIIKNQVMPCIKLRALTN